MDIFENLENLNISEECFNDIMDIVEELLNENSLEQQKDNAVNALKDLYRTYNSGRRHYQGQSKKLPGKIKKAEKDFDDAGEKVESAKWEVQKNFNSPEKEKATEVFKRVATGNYKDDNEKHALMDIHKKLSKEYHSQLDPKMEEATKQAIKDREEKREVMGNLRSSKTKDNIESKKNYYKKRWS